MSSIPRYFVDWDEVSKEWDIMVSPSPTSMDHFVVSLPSKEFAETLVECMNNLVENLNGKN